MHTFRVLVAIALGALSTSSLAGGSGSTQTYHVQSITLFPVSLQAQPILFSDSLLQLPFDATGIAGTGAEHEEMGRRWLEVTYNGVTGWVDAQFLVLEEKQNPFFDLLPPTSGEPVVRETQIEPEKGIDLTVGTFAGSPAPDSDALPLKPDNGSGIDMTVDNSIGAPPPSANRKRKTK